MEKYGTKFESGIGTESEPYIISCAEELKYFQDQVKEGNTYEGEYIKLVKDIYLNDTSNYENWNEIAPENEWIPIGDETINGFSGEFDGGEHKIIGIYINNEKDNQGLFSKTTNASLKNIIIEKGYISGKNYTGSIVGQTHNSNIQNLKNINVTVKGNNYTGGIIGAFMIGGIGNITKIANNCINEANVNGNDYVGGIIGFIHTNCNFGFSATNASGEILKLYNLNNKGKIDGSCYIGGIFGKLKAYRGSIYFYNSYNIGDILGKNYLGGCSGVFDSDNGWGGYAGTLIIGNLYNIGNVKAVEESGNLAKSFGGIYGDASCYGRDGGSSMEIKNCYSLFNTIGTKQTLCESWGSAFSITEENIALKTENEMKTSNFIDMLNIQKEQYELSCEIQLKKWIEGNTLTKGYPRFE